MDWPCLDPDHFPVIGPERRLKERGVVGVPPTSTPAEVVIACPRCGWLDRVYLLQLVTGGATCPGCGRTFKLSVSVEEPDAV